MSQDRLKVKNEPIVRDLSTGALLFTNHSEIEEYNKKRQKLKAKEDTLKNDINNLKTEIKELKEMLQSILNKLSGDN